MSSSSDGRDFKTDITADPSNFVAGMDKAKQAAATASDQINAQFKKIGDTVNNVNKYMMGFVAVLAGGGALKKFISDANEWNGSAGAMAKALGISTEKASVLNVALNRLGMDSDTYIGASQKLSKQINSNAAAFETLGVKTKDAVGQYRPVTEVMGEVNEKLAAIKNPIEQNIAGQQVYGKGWAEVKGILRLTSEQMTESERRARELGLIVGPEGVAMSKQYSAQMRDLGLVGKSLEVQFGNALLPAFTRMGAFMSQEGPAAGQVFATVIEGIGFAVAATWLTLKDMGDGIGAMAAQAAALLSGDIAGFKAIGRARDEEFAKNNAAYEKLKSNFGKPLTPAKLPDGPDINSGKHYEFKPEKGGAAEKSRMAEWEAKLAVDKAALTRQGMLEGQFREMTKAAELKYWNQLKAAKGLTEGEKTALARKAADVEMSQIKETFDIKVAKLQAESEMYRNNMQAKLAIEEQIQAKYAEGTKQFEEAGKRIMAINRQIAEQEKQVSLVGVQAGRDARLAALAVEEKATQDAAQMGILTNQQVLAAQAEFEQRRFAIAQEALAERLSMAELDQDKNPVLLAQIHAQIEQAEQIHQAKLGAIRSQEMIEATTNSRQMYQSITGNMESSFSKLMQQQQNFSGFVKSMWQSVQSAVANVLSKMLMDYIKNTAAMAAVKRSLAIFDIGANAAQAGAGAAASAAETPVTGWMIAAGAAAAAFSMASGFSSSVPAFSASQGFDIPGTLNPIVQTHAREMVLPAKHADVIRDMADGGNASGGAFTLNIHATDAQSVARLFRDNGEHLVAALQKQRRNLNF